MLTTAHGVKLGYDLAVSSTGCPYKQEKKEEKNKEKFILNISDQFF